MMSLLGFLTQNSRQHTRRISTLFLILTIALGLGQVYACRFELDPDSMDYLDIARQVSSGNWAAVANGYWGTLNSVLLAPLFFFHVPSTLELPLAHLYGILVLLASFFSFRLLLHACFDALNTPAVTIVDSRSLPEWVLSLVGYGLFLWTSLVLVPVKIIGPDLLVTVFVYLAAAMLLRLERAAPLRRFLLFGGVLGVGYWTKTIMFPIGLVFLCVSMLKVREWKRNLVSVLAFSIAAAPLLLALSLPRGQFSMGDSGKLNYSSFMSPGGRVINWQGAPAGSGIPEHPTRKLAGELPIYEFNGPVGGTYPPSYDPSYWNEGRTVTFNLQAQLTTVARHTPSVVELFFVAQPSLTAGFLFLLLWNPRRYLHSLLCRWDLLVISCAIIGLYMLVHFETRFVGAFVVFLWFSAFAALRVPVDGVAQRIAALSVVALVAVMLLSLISIMAKSMTNGCPESALSHVEMAQQLNLPPGTPVAVVGQGNFAYWAHLAQVHIVAEIMGTEETVNAYEVILQIVQKERKNLPEAVKQIIILITPGGVVALLLALKCWTLPQTTLAWIASAISSLLIAGYCMLVFDGRYVIPLAPLLIAFVVPFLLRGSPVPGNPSLRRLAGALFAVSTIFFTVFWASPFRSLRRDYQTSVYSAAAALRRIPSCNRVVAIGKGPFPMHGVGWEAGIYASYFAHCRVVGFSEDIPSAGKVKAALGDIQHLKSDSILLFGKPQDINYELVLRAIQEEGSYSTSKPLVDPEVGEIGRLFWKR